MEPFPRRKALRSDPHMRKLHPCKLRVPSSTTSGNNYGHMSNRHDFPSLPKPHDGSPVYLALLLDTGNRWVLPKKNETHIPCYGIVGYTEAEHCSPITQGRCSLSTISCPPLRSSMLKDMFTNYSIETFF